MATTVIYGNTLVSMSLGDSAGTTTATGSTGNQIIGNLSTYLGGVTRVQQVNNSASTTNPSATFSTTPVSGNALIAIVIRGSDNQASTNASWTLLTSNGVAGARRLEIWWRRAGASEPTTHTWTNATAALWEVTMIECGGWASITNPTVITSATNVTTTTSYTAAQGGPLAIGAIVTSAASAGTFTVAEPLLLGGFLESVGALPITTTTRFVPFYADAYVNYPDDNSNVGSTRAYVTWTTSRPFTTALVGWREGSTRAPGNSNFATVGQGVFTNTGAFGQTKLTFDTSTIPTANTVTSATLSLKSSTVAGWPVDTSVDAYSITSGSALSFSNSPTWWQTSSTIGGLTRVATRAAGSAWATSTVYTWTSDSAFISNVVKGGTTRLLLATGDQATGAGASRTNSNTCFPSGTASDHYLTIVHNFQGTATVAATLTVTPTISRTVAYARSIAASLTIAPVIARTVAYARTITLNVGLTPVVAQAYAFARSISTSTGLAPTVNRAVAYSRQIAATIGNIPMILTTIIPAIVGTPRTVILKVRNTLTLTQPDTIRMKIRSVLRLPEE